jgi:hypothetical protein
MALPACVSAAHVNRHPVTELYLCAAADSCLTAQFPTVCTQRNTWRLTSDRYPQTAGTSCRDDPWHVPSDSVTHNFMGFMGQPPDLRPATLPGDTSRAASSFEHKASDTLHTVVSQRVSGPPCVRRHGLPIFAPDTRCPSNRSCGVPPARHRLFTQLFGTF